MVLNGKTVKQAKYNEMLVTFWYIVETIFKK